MRAIPTIGIVALVGVATLSALISTAQSQQRDNTARCLSIEDMDRRAECLEGRIEAEPVPATPTEPSATRVESGQFPAAKNPAPATAPLADREIDCRDPRDRLMCNQLQSGGGRIANPNYLGPPQPRQNVQSAEGAPPSFVQWCKEHSIPPSESNVASCIEKNWPTVRHLSASQIENHFAQILQRERAKAETEIKERAEVAENLKTAKERGYNPVSFDDFKLDGKQLATIHAKVIMQGFYKRFGDIESLQPSGLAVAIAREYGNDNSIPLLTDDATRNVRKYFLQCGDNPAAPLGCPLTVIGHADMCTTINVVGSKNAPCLVVEDGW